MAASEASRRASGRETRTVSSVRSQLRRIVDATEGDAALCDAPNASRAARRGKSSQDRSRCAASAALSLPPPAPAFATSTPASFTTIKPSNIICSPRGRSRRFQRAMATSDQHLTSTGLVSSTARYTAPGALLQGHGATKVSFRRAWWRRAVLRHRPPPFGKGTSATAACLEGTLTCPVAHP